MRTSYFCRYIYYCISSMICHFFENSLSYFIISLAQIIIFSLHIYSLYVSIRQVFSLIYISLSFYNFLLSIDIDSQFSIETQTGPEHQLWKNGVHLNIFFFSVFSFFFSFQFDIRATQRRNQNVCQWKLST